MEANNYHNWYQGELSNCDQDDYPDWLIMEMMFLTSILGCCCLYWEKGPQSLQGEWVLPCVPNVDSAGTGPVSFLVDSHLFAAALDPQGPWRGSWCTSWLSEESHSCSTFCQEDGWESAFSAWQRHCWHFVASTSPCCWWRFFWSSSRLEELGREWQELGEH